MPLMEARPDALAHVYAQSLFELAESHGGAEQTETVLGELEDILELARNDATFGEFLSSRALSTSARDASLTKILEGRAHELTIKFVRVLNRKNRLAHLPSIVAALDELVQAKFGRVEVDVYTAAPIGADELALVKQRLGDKLGKEIIAHPYVDESMIGGIKVRVGDQLIDGSVATRLARLREQLNTSGRTRVRGEASSMLEQSEG